MKTMPVRAVLAILSFLVVGAACVTREAPPASATSPAPPVLAPEPVQEANATSDAGKHETAEWTPGKEPDAAPPQDAFCTFVLAEMCNGPCPTLESAWKEAVGDRHFVRACGKDSGLAPVISRDVCGDSTAITTHGKDERVVDYFDKAGTLVGEWRGPEGAATTDMNVCTSEIARFGTIPECPTKTHETSLCAIPLHAQPKDRLATPWRKWPTPLSVRE